MRHDPDDTPPSLHTTTRNDAAEALNPNSYDAQQYLVLARAVAALARRRAPRSSMVIFGLCASAPCPCRQWHTVCIRACVRALGERKGR